jgi:hypothetical protein
MIDELVKYAMSASIFRHIFGVTRHFPDGSEAHDDVPSELEDAPALPGKLRLTEAIPDSSPRNGENGRFAADSVASSVSQ